MRPPTPRGRFWLLLPLLGGCDAPKPRASAPLVVSHAAPVAACPPGTFASSRGTCVPNDWHCSPLFYEAGAEDGCDCDCGVPDPDCAATAVRYCYGAGTPQPVSSCGACAAAP